MNQLFGFCLMSLQPLWMRLWTFVCLASVEGAIKQIPKFSAKV